MSNLDEDMMEDQNQDEIDAYMDDEAPPIEPTETPPSDDVVLVTGPTDFSDGEFLADFVEKPPIEEESENDFLVDLAEKVFLPDNEMRLCGAKKHVELNRFSDSSMLDMIFKLTDLGVTDEHLGFFQHWCEQNRIKIEKNPILKTAELAIRMLKVAKFDYPCVIMEHGLEGEDAILVKALNVPSLVTVKVSQQLSNLLFPLLKAGHSYVSMTVTVVESPKYFTQNYYLKQIGWYQPEIVE